MRILNGRATTHILASLFIMVVVERSSAGQTYEFPKALIGNEVTRVAAGYSNFTQCISFVRGHQDISLKRRERADAESVEWSSSSGKYTVSGTIMNVASLDGGDTLFVALMDELGELVIERWEFTVREGQWIHRRPAIPTRRYSGVTSIKGAGAFAPPPSATHPQPARRVIYRGGATVRELRAMQVDPEGRFLLIKPVSPEKLISLDISGGPVTATTLYDGATDSATRYDLKAICFLDVADHATLGRVYIGTERSPSAHNEIDPEKHILLVDATNDGVFESLSDVRSVDWYGLRVYTTINNWSYIPYSGTEP